MKLINTCPSCKGKIFVDVFETRDRMFGISGTFFLKKCLKCSLLFLNPQLNSKELIKYYPSKKYYSYNNENSGLFFVLRKYLIKHYYNPTLLSKTFSLFFGNVPAIPSYKKNGTVMDIGCGSGDTLFLLQQLGWKTHGMDVDKNAIKIANKRGLKNVKLGSYKDLSKYPNNYFDVIRIYHVIEHVDDPRLCLKLIRLKLKNGGDLLIGTPNVSGVFSFLFKQYWYHIDSPRHLFLFSTNTLKKLAKEEKLKITNTRYNSTGTLIGSMQYVLNEKFKIDLNLLRKTWLVTLFYPVEFLSDKIGLGDVVILTFKK